MFIVGMLNYYSRTHQEGEDKCTTNHEKAVIVNFMF